PANPLGPGDPLSDTVESYMVLDSTHLTGEAPSGDISTDPDPLRYRMGSTGALESTRDIGNSASTTASVDGGFSMEEDTATESESASGERAVPNSAQKEAPGA